jgi:hypothetical protein
MGPHARNVIRDYDIGIPGHVTSWSLCTTRMYIYDNNKRYVYIIMFQSH